jgi:guanine deaminase
MDKQLQYSTPAPPLHLGKSAGKSVGKPENPGYTAYKGHVINPLSAKAYEDFVNGVLLVDEQGMIAAVGNYADIEQHYKIDNVRELGTRLIMPGFMDLHIHLPQFPQLGKSGQHLLSWLEKYIYPAESRFSDPVHSKAIADWFFKELARNGTTTAVVMTTVHQEATDMAFASAAEIGNRVIMGKVMMTCNAPAQLLESEADAIEHSKVLCRKWHGYDNDRLLYAFTPRFALTSSTNHLKATAKAWKEYPGSYFHTHLSESEEEVKLVAQTFPDHHSYLDVYADNGLIGANSIFAHAIHLDDADIEKLSTTQSALAHCPSSNFFLKSGVFPYDRLEQAGVKFGLGSDVAAGPQMSLFQVMKDANYIQPKTWLSPTELFYRATLAGAIALNLDHKIGNFAQGKEADFIVIDPTKKSGIARNMMLQPTDEILSSLVFSGDERLIEATFVRGHCIYSLEQEAIEATISSPH